MKVFPAHARYGRRAGAENESFLNAELFRRMFYEPLLDYGERVALFIFEFGTFSKKALTGEDEFLSRLDPFLASLAPEKRYAVEIRNPEFLQDSYFGCLRARNAAHVFNAWTRMPGLEVQTRIDGAYTADFTVTRALLRRGRAYEKAVKEFSPYKEIQDPNPEARLAMRSLIGRARTKKQAAYLFVNNRLEGNAPSTIEAIVGEE